MYCHIHIHKNQFSTVLLVCIRVSFLHCSLVPLIKKTYRLSVNAKFFNVSGICIAKQVVHCAHWRLESLHLPENIWYAGNTSLFGLTIVDWWLRLRVEGAEGNYAQWKLRFFVRRFMNCSFRILSRTCSGPCRTLPAAFSSILLSNKVNEMKRVSFPCLEKVSGKRNL